MNQEKANLFELLDVFLRDLSEESAQPGFIITCHFIKKIIKLGVDVLKFWKHIIILTTIFMSFAFTGCSGKMTAPGDNEIPEVPLEELTKNLKRAYIKM